MLLRLGLAFGWLSLVLGGCGEDDPPLPPVLADADPNQPDAAPADAVVLVDAPVDPEGPAGVDILDPEGTAEVPNILDDDRIDVLCHAEPNAVTQLPITSVIIEITDRAGEQVSATAAPQGNHNYAANDIFVGSLLNGMLTIRCTATDTEEKMNSDDEHPYLDLGPNVNILNPAEGSFVSGQITISFTVTPSPVLNPDDMDELAADGLEVILGGEDVTDRVMLAAGTDTYNGTISTTDTVLFPTGIVGPVQMTVRATNERMATREETVTFTVDDTPPSITIVTPEPGQLVGGIIVVEAEVLDPAGVNVTSVQAEFSNGLSSIAAFELVPVGADLYRGTYDSREIRAAVEALVPPTVVVFPTLTVTALDAVGNEGQVGEVVVMDYMPPLASLDPPLLREGKADSSGTNIVCSTLFDPLGDDATNDGQAVAQISEYRARIEDQANTASTTSDIVFYTAGVNEATAQLVFLDQTDEAAGPYGDALLVDTNDDGVCDEVNPLLLPPLATPPAAILPINLVGLTPTGDSYFVLGETFPDYPMCQSVLDTETLPPALCPPTGLQRIIEGPFGGTEPVIFTIPPAVDPSCVGFPIDLTANAIADGWFCVALRVEDNLGNVGISQPMRVCLDRDGNQSDGCPALPTYPLGVDEPGPSSADPQPVIPTGSPDIDCTGTFTPGTATTPATVDATDDCLMPNTDFEFPQFELRRNDVGD